MSRRSTPQREIDERAFPVRLRILVPEMGFGRLYGDHPDSIHAWLDREVGRADYAQHSGGRSGDRNRDQTAFYFRHPLAAARFLEAFPMLEIADGTASPSYTSPALPFGRR